MSGTSTFFGVAASFLGGLGLFLLGMWLMTDGLKLAAGRALERILGAWTRTRARGLAAGVLITAVVQSSSAVTVAAIGFVNAGLLTFTQAVWVLFGANVGTTMTGWLVALIGFKLKIEAFALPLLGLGTILRLTGEGTRRGALGTAAAGFGALFLGIDVLRDTFTDLGTDIELTALADYGALAVLAFVVAGILLTTLMQSSSAALAVALTAAGGGFIPINDAAAIVIGANVGTTGTALLAAIGATANARRAAGAHVLFNLLTGAVALVLLPWLVDAIEDLRDWLELDAAPATTLALFHTVFNLLGVLLMWPLADRMIAMLQARFGSADEDQARPRHLDANIAAVPTLALDALVLELRRLGGFALHMAETAVNAFAGATATLARDQGIVDRLAVAVGEFVARLHRAAMSPDSSERLPEILRVARYYDAVADLALLIAQQQEKIGAVPAALADPLARFRREALRLLALADTARADFDIGAAESALAELEELYQQHKAELLRAGADGRLSVTQMEALLQSASFTRRAVQQAAKAARRLDTFGPRPVEDPSEQESR
jgi:phosphate:Na+ symporter